MIGTEFMPKLDEGNVWLTITLPTPVSLNKAKELEKDIRASLHEFREVKSVLTQLGRPEDGTDPKGFNNLEILDRSQAKGNLALSAKRTSWSKRWQNAWQYFPDCSSIFPR